jgi:hypothetical protein
MPAILFHFLGFLLINSAIPPWVGSADAYFLAKWYIAFAAVDLIACALAKDNQVRMALIFSMAWSVGLSVEQLMLLDFFQRNDWLAQIGIDGVLIALLVMRLVGLKKPKRVTR